MHPLILAATFHYRFVAIHPFDDGNGRMARLLMNLLLMQAGYVPVVVKTESKPEYLIALENADSGDLTQFILLIGENVKQSLQLYLRAARNESLEDTALFAKSAQRLQEQLKESM